MAATDPQVRFYDEYPEEYAAETLNIDVSDVYAVFESKLSPGSRVLDAGCGAGRDTKYFASKGYEVTAIDASMGMVKYCSEYSGQPALHMRFEDLDYEQEFNGIWALASLVHLDPAGVQQTLRIFRRALVPGGVVLVSLRQNIPDRPGDPRRFYPWTETQVENTIGNLKGLDLKDLWVSEDARGPTAGTWIIAVLRRSDS